MKRILKVKLVLMAVLLLSFYSCEENEDDTTIDSDTTYIDITAEELKIDLIDDASISPYKAIFDVSPHYDEGHLPFATNTGSVDGLETILGSLDTSKSYLVYCHADAPSIAGAELLIENGFKNVYRLEGNFEAWDEVSFVDIAADEAKTKIDASDFEAIFDVSPNYGAGHLLGATNAHSGTGGTDLSELISGLDTTKAYLVYCHADAPAISGAQLMEDEGFHNVYRLEGNYGAWVGAGYGVEN